MTFKYCNKSLQFSQLVRNLALFILSSFFLLALAQAQFSFGRTQTNSVMGQPLQAYIEVNAPPQIAGTIRGRAYRPLPGGRIDNSITTNILRRQNGVIVQLGSLSPINEPFVNVVIELVSNNGASVSQAFSLLINPSSSNSYSIPNSVYSKSRSKAPRPRLSRSRSSSNSSISALDRKINDARAQLARLKKQIDKIVGNKKAPPTKVSVVDTTTPAVIKPIAPIVTPKPVNKPIIITETKKIIQPVAAVAKPKPRVVAKPKPKIARPKPVKRTAKIENIEEGWLGFSWLPNPEAFIASLGLSDVLTTEVLMIIGIVLIIIAIIIILSILRKRKKTKYQPVDDEDDHDPSVNDIFGGVANMSDNVEEQNAFPDDSDDEQKEEKPKKKKSFLSKLKKIGNKKSKSKKDDSDEDDFAAMVVAEEQAKESAKSVTKTKKKVKSKTKIARFEEEGKAVESAPDKNKEDDFLKDLESITQTSPAVEPTIAVNSLSEVKHDDVETMLTPSTAEIADEEPNMPFSDEITRVSSETEVENDLVSSSMAELISDDPVNKSAGNEDNIERTEKRKEPEEAEVSLDDLDFSSEKTMIMPQLKELVKEAEAGLERNAEEMDSDFEFSFNSPTPTKPKTTKKPQVADSSPAISLATESKPLMDEPTAIKVDAPDLQMPKLDMPSVDAPALDKSVTKNKTKPVEDITSTVATLDDLNLPDLELPTFDDAPIAQKPTKNDSVSKTQLVSTQMPVVDSEDAFDELELPDLNLPNLDDMKIETSKKATVKDDNTQKDKNTQNSQVMIDLAALDLSSIKLD